MNFSTWLAAAHPDVRLTPIQDAWVKAHEKGWRPVWQGGSRSGKTFMGRLWLEYEAFRPLAPVVVEYAVHKADCTPDLHHYEEATCPCGLFDALVDAGLFDRWSNAGPHNRRAR